MKFDKAKSCFVNDNGSKLEVTESVVYWRDSRYARWCREGIITAGKEVVDCSWAWKASDKIFDGNSHNKSARQWTGV